MREIKFRVWDLDNKKWYHSPQLVIRPYSGTVTDGATTPNVELLQYTGLKDKNGKEIYEGDIVRYKFAFYKDISKVVFNEEVAKFEMIALKDNGNSSCREFKKDAKHDFVEGQINGFDYVEVLGNIYENPELLEVK